MISPARLSHPWVRALLGITISVAFVAATLTRIDVRLLERAWAAVDIRLVLVAVAVSAIELAIRALRWRLVLRRFMPASYGTVLGYLSIGHLANAVLPARLGDVARAVAVGVRFGVSRTSVLGTIALERVSDASLLGLAVSMGVLIGFRQLAPTVIVLFVAVVMAILAAIVLFAVLRHRLVSGTRAGKFLRARAIGFWAGATALRSRPSMSLWVALTVASFTLTVLILLIIAEAVGISLAVWQAALVMAAVTLSTAIPAGPASIGTYEFVGMTLIASLGIPVEQALLCVALVHAIVVLPPAMMGLAAMWWLGVRPRPRIEAGPAAPERT